MQEAERQVPVRLQYRGHPRQYVSILLKAIDEGRLFYGDNPNITNTLRVLSRVIDVVSPKTGKVLSIETLISYAKKEHSGDFVEYNDGVFDIDYTSE